MNMPSRPATPAAGRNRPHDAGAGDDPLRLSLQLLHRIPRGRAVTARQLHEQLAAAGMRRDVRSIQRQLQALCEQFDIEVDRRGKPYGYRWREHARSFSVPGLTPQEALLLRLAEQHLRPLLPTRLMQAMEPFFEQAQRGLQASSGAGADDRAWARAWLGKVRVVATSQPLLPPEIAPGVLEAVTEALYNDQQLQLTYRNAAGRVAEARVLPLGIAQQGPRLYLVARYEGFADERILALHRMLSAERLDHPFERPAAFDLAAYDGDGRFGFGEGRRVELRLRIARHAGAHLLETPLSRDQQATPSADGEWLDIRATVVDSAMLDWWLRGFGDAVAACSKHAPGEPSLPPAA